MADSIRYIHPLDQLGYSVDFQDVLPTEDASLNDIDAGSSITAVDSAGDDAEAILFGKSRISKTLNVTFKGALLGESYRVTFLGQGVTSTQRFTKTLELRCRDNMAGEF